MATRFQPHGEFRAYVDGRIIMSEVMGPWNKELVDNWAAQLHGLAKELCKSGPHVGMSVIRGSMLCPPDALEAIRRASLYGSARMRSVGNIIVADAGVEGRALMLPTYARLYEGASAHRIFYDFDSARAWALLLLAEQGY